MKITWTRRNPSGQVITYIEVDELELAALAGTKHGWPRRAGRLKKELNDFVNRNKLYMKNKGVFFLLVACMIAASSCAGLRSNGGSMGRSNPHYKQVYRGNNGGCYKAPGTRGFRYRK